MTSGGYIPPGHIGGQINADTARSQDGDFNVDPGTSYLAEAGRSAVLEFENTVHADPSAERNNFVGGFVSGIKRAMRGDRNRETLEADLEHQSESVPPSSETLHESLETAEAETTAFDHDIYYSPVLAEPQPASDYAKMDSPTPPASDVSFNSYVARFQRFIRDLNDLPWVADRVTVDYIPGQSKRRARPRPTHRPIMSWYNEHARRQHLSVDLLSSGSPSSPYSTSLAPVPVQMRTTNEIDPVVAPLPRALPPGTDYARYPTGYIPYQPPVSAYPQAVVFPRPRSTSTEVAPMQQVEVPNQYPYPVFR